MVKIGNSWDEVLATEFQKEYYQRLRQFLKREYATKQIYPDMYAIFNAFRYTDFPDVKIVILGQDPYHGPHQAHGLCFSVQEGVTPPPSLVNIYKELYADLGLPPAKTGCLIPWAEQGVMLLNTTLTVEAGKPLSHFGKGWEVLTDKVISLLGNREKPLVFLLWGRNARNKKGLIDTSRHLVLEAPHPSPLSASSGFFGCRHFSKANAFLIRHGVEPVDFDLDK